LSLKDHLGKLFQIILEEDPAKYAEIVSLAGKKKARLSDGHQSIIFYIKHSRVEIIDDKRGEELPTGSFAKTAVISLIDGQLTLNEAIKSGLIDCRGEESDVLVFYKMLRIVLYVSARSTRAYELWKAFK
jgi:hypothetical protein